MTTIANRITPFLWFNTEAEQAATFYTSVFKNAKVTSTTRYSKESAKASGQPDGNAMTVSFELENQRFVALNGGPHFRFTEAISFVVNCESQEEIDYFWNKLSEGGDPNAQQCGWLKDKFGLSWQIVPVNLPELLTSKKHENAGKGMAALMKMKKIDIDALRNASG